MGEPGSNRRNEPHHPTATALLGAVIETSDDAIFTCDSAGSVTSWGATAERLFGRRIDDVLAHGIEDLFSAHLRGELLVVMARVLSGEKVTHFESEIVRSDGMPMPVRLSLCPVFGEGPRPEGTVVITRDVTEQHLAQAALAEVESRLEEAETLARVGSWLWDLRTGAVQWSTEFHRIHGVDPMDFDGTLDSHIRLVHPDDRDMVRAAMDRSLATARPLDCRYRVVCPDRQIRVVHVRAQPAIGSSGAPVGLRGIGREIVERARRTDDDPVDG